MISRYSIDMFIDVLNVTLSSKIQKKTTIQNTLFGHILDTIEKKSFDGRLLVGTGCGLFLHAARERGWLDHHCKSLP